MTSRFGCQNSITLLHLMPDSVKASSESEWIELCQNAAEHYADLLPSLSPLKTELRSWRAYWYVLPQINLYIDSKTHLILN